ncbi:hypothetical protein HMPREF1551_00907 [Capnocytophaga sp. oral taxon 863 str. F0517]|nr:hypothetical protein HMPREF1551_00907 [Capnocytophaga sp. oral taxon 863 str. F0517]
MVNFSSLFLCRFNVQILFICFGIKTNGLPPLPSLILIFHRPFLIDYNLVFSKKITTFVAHCK